MLSDTGEIIRFKFKFISIKRAKIVMEIIPVNFGLKYRPPKLGLEYHIKDHP
jgi:hypothetical protein